MQTDPLSQILGTVNLIGAAHGLFLASLIIVRSPANRRSALLLAAFTVAYSMVVGGTMLGALGYYRALPHLILVGDPFVLLLGPLLYLYAVELREGRTNPTRWLHLAPFALYVVYRLPAFYLLPAEAKVDYVEGVMTAPDPQFWVMTLVRMAHVGAYVVLLLVVLYRHRQEVEQTHSDVQPLALDWMRWTTYALAFVWAVAILLNVVSFAGWMAPLQANYLIAFAMSVVAYAIGYAGMGQPDIAHLRVRVVAANGDGSPAPLQGELARAVTDVRLQSIFEEIRRSMQDDQLWMEGDLNIQDLAESIERPKYLVSSAINELSGTSFNRFINSYRVEQVKRRLRDPSSESLTVLAIAMESGFNSKSSFNAAFQQHTGHTPSAFRSSIASAERERVRI